MLPFRTEIRNSPRKQTIKVYISDISCDKECKALLETTSGVDFIEIQDSVSRNRAEQNLTVFIKEETDVNVVHKLIVNKLDSHFAFD